MKNSNLYHKYYMLTREQRRDAMIILGILSACVCTGIGLFCDVKKHKINAIKELAIKGTEIGNGMEVKF